MSFRDRNELCSLLPFLTKYHVNEETAFPVLAGVLRGLRRWLLACGWAMLEDCCSMRTEGR